MDISPILQELSTMKYDLISVRSTRTPYKVSRPVDIYAALRRYANAKTANFAETELALRKPAPQILARPTKKVGRLWFLGAPSLPRSPLARTSRTRIIGRDVHPWPPRL
jgi:hypothetical protein